MIIQAAYYLVSVEDTTNNEYQLTELIVLNDNGGSYITEYGTLNHRKWNWNVRCIHADPSTLLIYDTLLQHNVDVETRVFQQAIQLSIKLTILLITKLI